ncbi:MAG: hypothetical protein HEP71_09530 [Roseivirga sp.]|nr:hypothetical protein [Roseivirga sp.]
MRKPANILIAVIFTVITLSCSGDEGGESTPQIDIPSVSQLLIIDNGNHGDSRDLFISFIPPTDETHISEYNLILIKPSSSTQVNDELAKTLSADRYYQLDKTGVNMKEQVLSAFLDVDGDPIVSDQIYNTFVYSRPIDETAAGKLSSRAFFELKDEPYYEVKTFITFQGMEAISYYEQGNHFVGPSANGTLVKVDVASGASSQFASGLATPYGGGFDQSNGIYYASNFDTGEVWAFDENGTRTATRRGLNGPTGIAVDKQGNIYVNNYWSSTISKITPEGQKSTFSNNASGLIRGPDGIIFVGEQLYCINYDNSDILKISGSGEVSLFARLPGAEMGYLAYDNGSFFAASISEKKIFRITQNGQHEVIAGNGLAAITDGPGPLASFSGPNGIAAVNGIVYVSDGSTLRMIIKHD